MTLQELGQAIREKRTAANLSIDDVAGRIKISSRILKSIEEGSLVGLPHAVYSKSFIRTFGLLVGYDPAELARHLDELFPPESLDETRNEPGPRTRTLPVSSGNGRNMLILLFLVVMLGVLAAGGWYVVKNYGDMILNLVKTPFSAITAPPSGSELAERRQSVSRFAASAAPAKSALPPWAAPVSPAHESAPQVAGTHEQERSPDDGAPAPIPYAMFASPAFAGVAASGSASAAAQPVQTREDEKNSLRIVADQPCWTSFRADGVKGRDSIVQTGENLVLTYKNSLEIVFGNAGGVSVTHNGRDIGRPGRPGQRAVMSFPRADE